MTEHAQRTSRGRWVAALAVLAVAVPLVWLAADRRATADTIPKPNASPVSWQTCPTYSDDVLGALGISPSHIPAYRAVLDRMQCGTVSVPLDYRDPNGTRITVALTRVPAVDQAHRLGSLAVNPGGPGESGYLMPIQLISSSTVDAELNDRYDLIGFDPRGVGYSTKFDCPQATPITQPVGVITEAEARAIYDQQVANNKACGNANRTFLSTLTTLNVARDMDQIRAALGEPKLNFLGISWGTSLGAVYHTEFAVNVGRMFLDSVAPPHFRMDTFTAARADAAERDFDRMAAWIAQHNDVYGFGTTAAQVKAAVVALRVQYDAGPKKFTDLSMTVDGSTVARNADLNTRLWPQSARILTELRDSYTSATAPPTLKEVFGDDGSSSPPPAGTPEQLNPTMYQAAFCNNDPSRSDFATAWADYQAMQARDPAVGRDNPFDAGCAGWPLPVQTYQLHRTDAPVILSGHLHESFSVYRWTPEMRAVIGGTIFTVSDDVHASVMRVPDCAAQVVSYFNTGQITHGCAGMPVPDSTAVSGTS